MSGYKGGSRHKAATTAKAAGHFLFEHDMEAAWSWSGERWQQEQLAGVHRAYVFAREWVPYYKMRSEVYPPAPRSIDELKGFLQELPALTKDEVRRHNQEFRPPFWRLPTTTHTTSGTSGTPLRIYASLLERVRTDAALASWYRRLLKSRREPRLVALSGFVKGLTAPIVSSGRAGEFFINIYQISPRHRASYASLLDVEHPTVVAGYSSAIAELARVMAPLGSRARRSTVVIPTSEVCTPQHRMVISERLSSAVHGQYGSQEGGHLAFECAEGLRYHVHPLFGRVDIRSTSARAAEMETFISSQRRGMPLFNYQLGDVARLAPASCACGSGWPSFDGLQGRSEDLVVARDGRRIGYLLFHSTKALTSISEAQLIQKGILDFEVNLVLDGPVPDRKALESHVEREIEMRLGYPVRIGFNYLESIPRHGANGKFKAVIVEIPDGS